MFPENSLYFFACFAAHRLGITDITFYLNELYSRFQRKRQRFNCMFDQFKFFKAKLSLRKNQINNKNLNSFSTLLNCKHQNTPKYAKITSVLRKKKLKIGFMTSKKKRVKFGVFFMFFFYEERWCRSPQTCELDLLNFSVNSD